MRRVLLIVAMLLVSSTAFSRARIQGFCQQGSTTVSISGGNAPSTLFFQQSLPGSTVTIYAAGTTNISTIYSDNSGTVKANPFTCPTSSSTATIWFAYVDNGRYDVKVSGTGVTTPFTMGDFLSFDPLASTSTAGVFTNTQMNTNLSVLLNSCNPSTEYQAVQGGNNDTEGLTACIATPATATVHQSSPLAGFNNNKSTTTAAVGLYGECRSTANNVGCIGGNLVVSDDGVATGASLTSMELDFNILNTTSTGTGLTVVYGSAVQSTNANALLITSQQPASGRWGAGLVFGASSVLGDDAHPSISIAQQNSGVSQKSGYINFVSEDGAAGIHNGRLQELSDGSMIVQSNAVNNTFLAGVFTPGTALASPTASPATAGQVRLASADGINWRNNANGANVALVKTGAASTPFPADVLDVSGFGGIKANQYFSTTICAAAGSIAATSVVACVAAASGLFTVPITTPTAVTVTTTALTPNSVIKINQRGDTTNGAGDLLSVTCNTALNATTPFITSRTATSFTFSITAFSGNPGCYDYTITD